MGKVAIVYRKGQQLGGDSYALACVFITKTALHRQFQEQATAFQRTALYYYKTATSLGAEENAADVTGGRLSRIPDIVKFDRLLRKQACQQQ